MSKKNFFKLPTEEQRAILAAAVNNANQEQEASLYESYQRTQAEKNTLVQLINTILDQDYTAKERIVFTQNDNGTIVMSKQ